VYYLITLRKHQEKEMINYESQCPLCGTVQSVEIAREQPCIECLTMFTYTPTSDEVIGAIARMAAQLHERRQTNLRSEERRVGKEGRDPGGGDHTKKTTNRRSARQDEQRRW